MAKFVESGTWEGRRIRTARKAGRCEYWLGGEAGRCPNEIAVGDEYIEGDLSSTFKAGGFGRDRYCMTHAADGTGERWQIAIREDLGLVRFIHHPPAPAVADSGTTADVEELASRISDDATVFLAERGRVTPEAARKILRAAELYTGPVTDEILARAMLGEDAAS